jgi:hypothetical protein
MLGVLFNSSWLYQVLVFGLAFGFWAAIYFPTLYVYRSNNKHRTYEAAIAKERAHKKKLKELEKQAEDEAAASEAVASEASE